MNFSESLAVKAPADVLWETVKDLPKLPQVVTAVSAFEWVSSHGETPVQEGARFRETRLHRNLPFVLFKTVTRLDESNPRERSLSLGIALQGPDGSQLDTVNTSTLTVLIDNDDERCSWILLTGAFESGGCLGRLNQIICYPCIRRIVRVSVEQELQDYRIAAEQRNIKKLRGEKVMDDDASP